MKVMFHKKWKKCTQSRKSQYPQPNTYFDWLPKSFRLCFQHDFQRSNSFSEFLFCSNLMTSNWILNIEIKPKENILFYTWLICCYWYSQDLIRYYSLIIILSITCIYLLICFVYSYNSFFLKSHTSVDFSFDECSRVN